MMTLRLALILFVLALVFLVGGAVAIAIFMTGPIIVRDGLQVYGGGLFSYAGEEAVRSWESGGAPAFDHFRRKAGGQLIEGFLYDSSGHLLRGRSSEPEIDAIVAKSMRSARFESVLLRNQLFAAAPAKGASGRVYYVGFLVPEVAEFGWPAVRRASGVRILLALVILAICSTIFAQWLSGPLTRLGAVARRFASGDLAARAGPVRARIHELRDLARDFDEMAERIQISVDSQQRLLQYVSHELRTPLTRLSLALNMAQTKASEPDAASPLDRVGYEIERLNGLIDRILVLSKLQASHQPAILQVIEMADFLETIAGDAQFEASACGKRVRLDAAVAATLRGDREMLRGAIENVLRNGIRHTPDGGEVTMETVVREGSYWISIADSGPGVPSGQENEIFEPFVRLRPDAAAGYGLGLTITRRTMDLHGGAVRAVNLEPGGLQVTISLPLHAA